MALPPGITPKTVTIGIASFFDGSLVSGRATITAPVNVIHTPTQRPLVSSDITQSFVDGVATFTLCPTDAPGLNRVDWTYKLKVEFQGANVQPEVMYFPLPAAGPDVVDLDGLVTVPSSAGTPISVDVLTAGDLDPLTAGFVADTDSQTALALRAALVPRSVQGQEDLETQRLTALLPFHTALAKRNSAPVDVLALGHSFMEGVAANDFNLQFQQRFLAALRQRFPVSGVTGGVGYIPAFLGASQFTGGTFPAVLAGSPTQGTGFGLGRRNVVFDTAAKKATYTITGTGFDIFYVQYATGGVGYYKVDGGAAVTFTTAGTGPTDGKRVQVTGLSAGAHTVEVGWSSGAGVFHTGLVAYNGDETKGIRMWNGARSSQNTAFFADRTGSNGLWLANVATIQPSLVVICLLINDFVSGSTQTPPATSKANLQAIIADIKTQTTIDPSFVLCVEYARESSGVTNPQPWSAYRAVASEIAAADPSVLLFDMGKRFGAGPFNAGNPSDLLNPDYLHPSTAGQQLWADSAAAFVSPR